MKRLRVRLRTFRRRVRRREARYGWLFPLLGPVCLAMVVLTTGLITVIGHWDAVDLIEQRGGKVTMDTGYIRALRMRVPMFAEARSVELVGRAFDDESLQIAGNLRGLREVRLLGTRISDTALARFARDHPQVAVVRLGP